ncbi:MAG: hypothetical protein VX278_19030, partial [Myxococcota bacterium]|nr:hypothetical protein [Myxococcota bacterium]
MPSRQRSLCGIAASLILASLCTACTEPASEAEQIPTLQTLALAAEIAQEGAVRIPPETLAFDWMQTVWAYGIFRLHQASQAEQWKQYNRDWLNHSLDDFTGDDPHRFHSSDSMSPALIAASLMATDPTQDFSPIT